MAATGNGDKSTPDSHVGIIQMHANDPETGQYPETGHLQATKDGHIDYSRRAQWLRAAVLGANDGLLSVSSIMMGVGGVKKDAKAMFLAGFAGLVAGACSMAIGEFVSVYTQYDIEKAHMKRQQKNGRGINSNEGEGKEKLPSPVQAAVASALAFSVGAMVPLVGASFIAEHKVRLVVMGAVACVALAVFGAVGAVLGKTPVGRSCLRVVIGGVMAMAITFGLTKLAASTGLQL